MNKTGTLNKLKKDILNDKITTQFLEQIAGPVAPDIIKIYGKDSALSPEDISNKLKTKITSVRSTLNSLHYRGIACYKKVKNNQNLFEFFWEIKFKKIIELVLETEIENIKKLEEQINLQQDRDYFFCPKKCIEAPFEVAAAYDFKCPNCGKNLEMINTKTHISSLKRKKQLAHKNIEKLNNILENIEDKTSGYICE
ncbi:MAG: hypothetical protein PHT83_04785 [Bacilli bacterium]|nr:hypothetical protein [Bacilli bacterium]